MTNRKPLPPSAAIGCVCEGKICVCAQAMPLAALDLEDFWTAGDAFAALGYDDEPQPVPEMNGAA